MRPGFKRTVDLTAALTSIPDAPADSYVGNGMSSFPAKRLIETEISLFNPESYLIALLYRKRQALLFAWI